MIEKAEIWVKAGKGGNGVVSFRREKFIPFGGPDGGNGGRGGDIFIIADIHRDTLVEFAYRHRFRAEDGKNGAGNRKQGKRGADIMLRVPLGTVVWEKEGEEKVLLADLEQEGQKVLVARAGRGGYGNAHFVTSTYQAPRLAQKGEDGEEAELILELKLIADVAIIGYPSVGKSSLLAAVTAANPEIAPYPFTTREPLLGVVDLGKERFTLVEIPGLIEGAHLGRGLGHYFLRHSERARLFIHLLDGSSPHLIEDWRKVNKELALYNPALAKIRQVLAVNKIDLPEVQARLPEIKKEVSGLGVPVFFLSAITGEGVKELLSAIARMLEKVRREEKPEPLVEKVFRPQPEEKAVVSQKGDIWVVNSSRLEKLLASFDLNNPEARVYVRKQMQKWGIDKALYQAGAKVGDRVRAGEWEWVVGSL